MTFSKSCRDISVNNITLDEIPDYMQNLARVILARYKILTPDYDLSKLHFIKKEVYLSWDIGEYKFFKQIEPSLTEKQFAQFSLIHDKIKHPNHTAYIAYWEMCLRGIE